MAKLFKISLGLLFLVTLGFILWWTWKLVTNHMGAMLFYSYLGVASLFFLASCVSSYRTMVAMPFQGADGLIFGMSKAIAWSSSLGKARMLTAIFLESLHSSLLFPWRIVEEIGTQKNVQGGPLMRGMAYRHLHSSQTLHDFVVLALLGIAGAMYYWSPTTPYASLWATLAVIGIQTQLLVTLISGVSLPQSFRTQLGNPYLRFIHLALSSGVLLLIGYGLIRTHSEGLPWNFDLLVTTGQSLFTLGSVLDIIKKFPHIRPIDIFISLSTLIYYFTILASLMRWKDFQRNPENYLHISRSLITLGRYSESVKWLKMTSQSSAEAKTTQGMALLALNRIEEGLEAITKGAQLGDKTEHLHAPFIVTTLAPAYLLPSWAIMKVVDRWLNENPEPGPLFTSLQTILASKLLDEQDVIALTLDSRLHSWPIHRALLCLELGRRDEAIAALRQARPGSEFEEVIRLSLLLTINITQQSSIEEDHRHVHAWLDTSLPEVEKLSRELTGMELTSAYLSLLFALGFIRSIKVKREQELLYLVDGLRQRLTAEQHANPTLESILAAAERQAQDLSR